MGGDSPTSSVASSGASAYNSAASLPGSTVRDWAECACCPATFLPNILTEHEGVICVDD